ncbi:Pyruvate dehydrogenase E1 component [Planctomycetes bacterium Pan216]|uniref:Pyruvate dehydrogenase E1 component n=1 Tax=Kolteria novifilia TaxID=2527975 RepID=A0A518B4B2_9BACT|nr:Pyruvate dehydrogenase E1 component [Planctomycetes bacterium Pan216]
MLKGVTRDLLSEDIDPQETSEWLESLQDVIRREGPARAGQLLTRLIEVASKEGIEPTRAVRTPYINTIPASEQPVYPGDRAIERRIKSIIRWNAMAMVVRASKGSSGVGGHISTYASAATLYEVGFNHFFRGPDHDCGGDFVFFQGHASPGIYSRAFLEGRLTPQQLDNFRRELGEGGGLSSYPHPWLMPDFWQFPTVSMGLGPLMSIYQARLMRYLENRGLRPASDAKVWCFVGDGECDEVETLGALSIAVREKLDNLIFVVNCNLQRLDGPVRGNGKIIQELEGVFRGAGWNVLKVVWGSQWDPLLAADHDGLLVRRMTECLDGEYQKYKAAGGDWIRDHFFGAYDELKRRVEHLSDEYLKNIKRGGHDPEKVFAAYQAATTHSGTPTVVLAKTIKGYGLGDAGEGQMSTHQQKKLNFDAVREFRDRFGIPIPDDKLEEVPFYVPPADSPEMEYLHQRRKELGGYLPQRSVKAPKVETPKLEDFTSILKDSGGKTSSTTMAFNRILQILLKNKEIGDKVVPIIPDEARTFGLEPLFRQCGIYAPSGQLYEPVDSDNLFYYKEAKNGQILEEGINEAGSMCSFIAAGTSYSTHGINMIPFYIYYSMFGFQRVGDLVWAAADSRTRGFMLGGTAGRTTLNGEGLQHQDGHGHLCMSVVPNLVCYDPAYAFEVAVIIQDGLRRMYQEQEAVFYYITVYNENYEMPAMPEGAAEGILKGIHKLTSRDVSGSPARPQLFGSGSILQEALKAQEILAERFGIASDVWSATSYTELRRDAQATERWNRLHPEETPRKCYLEQTFEGIEGPFVSTSDNIKLVADQVGHWLPEPLIGLGTDGFGRSESREDLREHYEINADYVIFVTLGELLKRGKIKREVFDQAKKTLNVDPDKSDPVLA